jgi:hypothetical protein
MAPLGRPVASPSLFLTGFIEGNHQHRHHQREEIQNIYIYIYELATKQKNKMLENLNKIGTTTGKATPGPGSLAAYSWRGVAWMRWWHILLLLSNISLAS